jgi:AcrR family transcriptional regulator
MVTAPTTTRRQRLREATSQEILTVARDLLVREGAQAVALRAVAREMGMTAPALYRYYASHEDLLSALIVTIFDEVSDTLEAAMKGPDGSTLDADVVRRTFAVIRALRRWAVDHPAEFGLVFGTPVPGYDTPEEGPVIEACRRFGGVFQVLFQEFYTLCPFAADDAELSPALEQQLRQYADFFSSTIPLPALAVLLSCWARVYGLISLEVFGHMQFALTDVEPLFEAELAHMAMMIGVPYQPPEK